MARQPAGERTRAVWTLPNIISMVRLAGVPLFLWLVIGPEADAWAIVVLMGSGFSDWLDGYLARRLGQVSNVGKVLDPVADRILLIGGITAILVEGAVPVWVAVLAIGREVAVAIATLVLAAMGARRIDVQWAGKAGTFGFMFAFPLFLGAEASTDAADVYRVLAWICTVPGMAFSYYSLARYVPLARAALAEGRADKAAQEAPG